MKNHLERKRCRTIISGSFKKDIGEIKDINSVVELFNIYLPRNSWNSYECVRKMLVNIELYDVFTIPEIKNPEGEPLKVYAPKIFIEHILRIIGKLSQRVVRLDGELCTFANYIKGEYAYIYPFDVEPDFWWDIDNAFYMFFGEDKVSLIQEAQKQMRKDSLGELEVVDWDTLSQYYYLVNDDLSEEALEFLKPKKKPLIRKLVKVLNTRVDNLK